MKLGILRRGDRVADVVWAQLPELAQWALLAKYGSRARELLCLGDLRGAS